MILFDRIRTNIAGSRREASVVEVLLIGLTLFCLPLFEAPKNVFSALFLIVWLIQASRMRSIGSSAPFNWPVLGLMAILWIAPLFSAYVNTITPINSAPRWTLLALFVVLAARLDYTRSQLMWIWMALLVGGTFAVFESFWVWSDNGKPYPEFRSVGHVNHSSMYSLVTLGAGIGALFTRQRWMIAAGILAILSTLAYLPPSRSLVGGVAITAILMSGAATYAVRRWSIKGLSLAVLVGVTIVGGVLMTPPASDFRSEVVYRVTGDNFFSGRDKILNSALAVWDQHPLLGTGWFSFGTTTSEPAVRAALESQGLEYDPNVYWHHAHGHNLWTTVLIERGLTGVILITVLLIVYFKIFLRLSLNHEDHDPFERAAATAALLIAVGFAVAGLGNTTMMNEHGHAGMALIAVAYGYLRSHEATKPQS